MSEWATQEDVQWVNIAVFAGIAGNNYLILRKLRSQ